MAKTKEDFKIISPEESYWDEAIRKMKTELVAMENNLKFMPFAIEHQKHMIEYAEKKLSELKCT